MKPKSTLSLSVLVGAGISLVGVIMLVEIVRRATATPFLNDVWPIILFFFGLLLVSAKEASARSAGVGLAFAGCLFTLLKINAFSSQYAQIVIAAVLIIFGLLLITRLMDRLTKT